MTKKIKTDNTRNTGINLNLKVEIHHPPASDLTGSGLSTGQNNRQNKQSENKQSEVGGPSGLEPTRYGDWEVNGRCSDF